MRWDDAVRAVGAITAADPTLLGIYPAASIRLGTESGQKLEPNVLEYELIADNFAEQWAPCTIQFDQFCASLAELRASEARLITLFHLQLPGKLDGMFAWSEYIGGGVLGVPARDGYYGRWVRFRVTPLRSFYASEEE